MRVFAQCVEFARIERRLDSDPPVPNHREARPHLVAPTRAAATGALGSGQQATPKPTMIPPARPDDCTRYAPCAVPNDCVHLPRGCNNAVPRKTRMPTWSSATLGYPAIWPYSFSLAGSPLL